MAENEISPSCEYMHIHSDLVDKVNENMPDDDILCDLAELYRVFGDSTRIRILYALFESEMCVCDIAQVLQGWLNTAAKEKPCSILCPTTMSDRS